MLHKSNNLWSWLWSTTFLTGFVSLILLSLILSVKRRSKGKSPSPPGPTGLPFVGYLPFLGSDLRWTFKDLADIYGPIFKVRLGTKEVIVITSPSLAKEVLRDKDVVFSNRDPTIAAKTAIFEASDIAFSNYGPELRKMKKFFVSEMLSNVNLGASYCLRKRKIKNMINTTYVKTGELVDIGELAFSTIISLVMSMVWGDTVKGLDGTAFDTEFRSVVNDFMLLLGKPNISDYIPCLALFDLQGIQRKMKSVADRFEKLFDFAIEQRTSDNIDQKDFLGCLLELTKAKDPISLSQVKGILLDAIIGGVDTTATTIEWAMAEILKHPEIMKNVQEELTAIIGLNNRVEEGQLGELKYLNAVLKETLRLHPPIPLFFPHSPSSDATVGGYSVRNNSQVYINTWAIHRDQQIWEAPSEFRPERFLNGSKKLDFLGKQFQYLPFGSGRRMCPGITLAEKTSMFVLASLLHSFEWKLPNGAMDVDLTETFGIVVKKSKAMVAVPSPRLSKLELYSISDTEA